MLIDVIKYIELSSIGLVIVAGLLVYVLEIVYF